MKLWLLKMNLDGDFDLNDPDAKYYVSGYGHIQGFVIRAATEQHAREFAAGHSTFVSGPWWLDAEVTTCVELPIDGEAGIILADEPTG